jgi:hypothetical protein
MTHEKDMTGKIPLWAQLRIDNDFANDDEKKQLEALAQLTVDKNMNSYSWQESWDDNCCPHIKQE